MGGSQSNLSSEKEAAMLDALQTITNSNPIPYQSPMWEKAFGAFFEASSDLDVHLSNSNTFQKYGARFLGSNLNSKNLVNLSLHACSSLLTCLSYSKSVPEDLKRRDSDYAYCSLKLLVCRLFLQYFIEHLKQDVLSLHLSGWPEELPSQMFDVPEVGKGVPRVLMKTLVAFLVHVPVGDLTYKIHEESLTLIIVLFSTQMFHASVMEPSLFLDMLVEEGEYFGASAFVGKMFENIETRRSRSLTKKEKDQVLLKRKTSDEKTFFSKLAGYGTDMVLFPIRFFEWFMQGNEEGVPVIANLSVLLLLQIGNCRESSHFTDAFTLVHDPQQSSSGELLPKHAFEEDFSRLFETFCVRLNHDPHVLLFYFMLHRNKYFHQFILSRTDLDVLLLPLLEHLYNETGREGINPQQVYMILIILLMLSQQDEFGVNCERLRIPDVEFYKEQVLLDVSLADLIAIVLVRTVTLNLSRLQDGYLHTNCLAILANMSSSFSHLHFYSAQRLLVLMSFLHRRLAQVQGMLVQGSSDDPILHIVVDTHTSGLPVEEDVAGMVSLYDNLLGILLEVFQAIVSHSIARNTSFVYALLHSRDQLDLMSTEPKWSDKVKAILSLVHHFDPFINDEPKTIEDVISTIERGVINWPVPVQPKGILKFTYTEETNAAKSFFLPYTLSLVYTHCGVRINPSRITMFCLPEWQTEVNIDDDNDLID